MKQITTYNKVSFKNLMLILMLILSLIAFSQSKLNNQIPQPILDTIQGSFQDSYTAKSYQTFTRHLPQLSYLIGTKVYQRQPKSTDNGSLSIPIILDKNYSNQFFQTQNCVFNDPEFNVSKMWEQTISIPSAQIIDYIYNQHQGKIVLLTEKTIQRYRIQKNTGHVFSQGILQIPSNMDIDVTKNTHFIRLHQNIGLISGKNLYKLRFLYQQQTNFYKIQVQLWQTLPFSQVVDAQFELHKVICHENYLLTAGDTFLKLFLYSKQDQKFQTIKNQFNGTQLASQLTKGEIIDVIWQVPRKKLWILTDNDGIIQMRDWLSQDFQIIHHNFGQLGICQSFIKFDNIFQIIFKTTQKGQQYVAQFYLQQNFDSSGKLTTTHLILNRFYDKIYPARDVQQFNSQLFILGDNQFHLYGPAVNRKIYLKNQFMETPYIGYSYDFKWLSVINGNTKSYYQPLYIVAVSDDKFHIFNISKTRPNITCSLNKKTDLWIKIWGTCPHKKEKTTDFMKNACVYYQLIHVDIANQFEWWQGMLITGGIIFLVAFCACLNWGFIGMLYQSKNKLNKLREKFSLLKNKFKKKEDGSTWNNLNGISQNKQSDMQISDVQK